MLLFLPPPPPFNCAAAAAVVRSDPAQSSSSSSTVDQSVGRSVGSWPHPSNKHKHCDLPFSPLFYGPPCAYLSTLISLNLLMLLLLLQITHGYGLLSGHHTRSLAHNSSKAQVIIIHRLFLSSPFTPPPPVAPLLLLLLWWRQCFVVRALARGILQLVGEPVEALVQTVTARGARRLNVPVAVPQRM